MGFIDLQGVGCWGAAIFFQRENDSNRNVWKTIQEELCIRSRIPTFTRLLEVLEGTEAQCRGRLPPGSPAASFVNAGAA